MSTADTASRVKNTFITDNFLLQNKYADLPIWMDVIHVAYNENSMIYSEDVAKKIISEII